MIGGVLLAGWITARCTGQRPADLLDTGCLALPLFMIFERLGEQTTVDFDISRVLPEGTAGGWLKVQDIYGTYLAVFRIAAILACTMFFVLETVSRMKKTESGDVFNIFMLLFGSIGILTESLRHDEFLSYHFVKFQMVGAALLLGGGLLAAALRCGKAAKQLKVASAVCLVLMVGIVIGLEFVLDRTRTNPVLVYCGMILTVAVPTVIGLLEIRTERKG